MSLINDVLKDLDDRRASPEGLRKAHPDVAIAPVRAKRSQFTNPRLWLALIVLVALALLSVFLFGVYQDYSQRLEQRAGDRQEAAALLISEPMAVAQMTPPATRPVTQVSAVLVQPLNQGLRLELQLSAKVAHAVEALDDARLRVHLPGTELAAILPSVAEYSLLRALDLVSSEDALTLEIKLTQPVGFQTYLLARGQYYALMLDMIARPQPPTVDPEPLITDSAPTATIETLTAPDTPESAPQQLPSEAEKAAPVFSKSSTQLSLQERDRRVSQDALAMLQRGDSAKAVALLSAFIDANPKALVARETWITWALAKQNWPVAEAQLQQALAQFPAEGSLIKLQSRLLTAQQQTSEALQLLQAHLPQHTQDVEYLALMAPLLQQQGAHSQAVELYRSLLRQDAQQAAWWVGLAISLEAMGLNSDALQAYLQARRVPQIDARLKQYADSRIQALE